MRDVTAGRRGNNQHCLTPACTASDDDAITSHFRVLFGGVLTNRTDTGVGASLLPFRDFCSDSRVAVLLKRETLFCTKTVAYAMTGSVINTMAQSSLSAVPFRKSVTMAGSYLKQRYRYY